MSGERADIVIRRYDFHVGAATLSDDRWFGVWVPSVVWPAGAPGRAATQREGIVAEPGNRTGARCTVIYIQLSYSSAWVEQQLQLKRNYPPHRAAPRAGAGAATGRAL